MPRVLFVDDQLDICEVVAVYLRERGFATTTASGGAAARQLIANEAFDIVVLDAVLPGVRGLELAALARARKIPILLVSGEAAAIQRNREAAQYPILEKPFRLAKLDAAIDGILKGEATGVRPTTAEPAP